MGVTLYTSRVILKTLGVEDYGIWNVVGGVVAMVSFLSTSIANGFQRYFNIALGESDDLKLRSYFSTSLLIEFFLSLICLIVLETLGVWFVNHKLTIPENRLFAANWVYQCSVLAYVIALIRAPFNAIIIAYEKMGIFALISIIEAFGKLLVALFISVLLFDRLISFSLLNLFFTIFIFIVFVYYAKGCNPNLKARIIFKKREFIDMLSFSGWNLFGSLAHVLKGNGLNIVLNLFFNPIINAARGIAYQVSSAIGQFSGSFLTASRPQVIKYYAQGDFSSMIDLTNRISRYSFCLMWLISFPIINSIHMFLRLWLGPDFPALTPLFCIIVISTTLVESFASPIATLVHASGKMKEFQVVVSSVILLIVPVAYIVLKAGAPPQSAFYVSLILVSIAHVARLLIVRKVVSFPLKTYFTAVILPCILVVLSSSVVLLINRILSIIENEFAIFLLSFTSVSLSIFYIGLTTSERSFLVNRIKNYLNNYGR